MLNKSIDGVNISKTMTTEEWAEAALSGKLLNRSNSPPFERTNKGFATENSFIDSQSIFENSFAKGGSSTVGGTKSKKNTINNVSMCLKQKGTDFDDASLNASKSSHNST